MKNAMKKLLSLVLVAMLLVSAVPFQASAAGGTCDFVLVPNGSSIGKGEWVEGVNYVRITLNDDGTVSGAEYDKLAAAVKGKGIIGWAQSDDATAGVGASGTNFTGWGNAFPVFQAPAAKYTFTVDYADGRTQSYTVEDGTAVGTDILPTKPTSKGRLFTGWYLDGTKVEAGSVVNWSWDGKRVVASWDIVGCTECGMTDGHATDCSQYVDPNNSNNSSNSATTSYAHVILDPNKGPNSGGWVKGENYLEFEVPAGGYLTETQISQVRAKIGSNIIGWSLTYGDTNAVALSNLRIPTDGGTTNVFPVTKNTTTNPPASGEYIYMRVYVDNSSVGGTQKKIEAASATVDSLIKNWKSDWTTGYEFNYYTINSSKVAYTSRNDTVYAGDTVYIYMNSRSTSDGTSKYNSNKVRLHVFLNGKVDEAARTFDITNNLAADYTVSLKEVSNYLLNYYSAKDSKGINFDGLYLVKGNWLGEFIRDGKVDTIADIDDKLEQGYVDINIMLDNATAKTTSTADSSNPKTGDSIYMTVTVMGLSVAALAAVYYVSKKRVVR